MLSPSDVQKLITESIPDSTVEVSDMTGTSDHFDIRVSSAAFAGKSRIEQHKMVQHALREHLTTTIHAVDIKTSIPES